MSINQIAIAYLVASVFFILSLRGLSSPLSARKGNLFGIIGMILAVSATIILTKNWELIILAIAIGGLIGTIVARRIEMTQMPELVAAMHSLVGLAAVLIAVAAVNNPEAFGILSDTGGLPFVNRLELFIGTFVGAITFSGSVVAFGKLSGKLKSAPIVFRGQHQLNLLIALTMMVMGALFMMNESWAPFVLMTILAFLIGVLIIIPIGGADMPVVISMLNSYSGWAAAGIGFSLNNTMLIISGSLVGSSGAILSYIMCKAMNRSFFNVILGGFGGDADTGDIESGEKTHRSGSAEDAAFLLSNAESVIVIPGYGLAVARAQHAVKEMPEKLTESGVTVRYAIHPVAGRMPGHMNVLLAEAEIPYDQVLEMDEINSDFSTTDVVLVLGANDVVNPAANIPGSPIHGMPILDAYKAKTVLVVKRSMAVGYAGLDNDLFYMDKTMMIFGDAKKVVEKIVKN